MHNKDIKICHCENFTLEDIFLLAKSVPNLNYQYLVKNIRAGKFGIAGVHSFHRTKTICTGEGGALLLDNKKLYLRAKFLRDHGRSSKIPYYTLEATPKYMPNNLQGSLAIAQFERIDELIKKKREIYLTYKKKLSHISGLQFNSDNNSIYNGVWATSIVFDKSLNSVCFCSTFFFVS